MPIWKNAAVWALRYTLYRYRYAPPAPPFTVPILGGDGQPHTYTYDWASGDTVTFRIEYETD